MWSMFSLLTDANLINMELVSKYSRLRTISMYLSYITTNNKRGLLCQPKATAHQGSFRVRAQPTRDDVTWLQATPSLTVPARTQNDRYTQ